MNDKELFWIIIISFLIVIALAIGIIVLYKVFESRILTEAKEAHQKELDHKNQLISNTIEVQERERHRIAKDLHDDIGSKLSVVNLNLNLLKDSIEPSDKTDMMIDHIELSLSESIKHTRTISHNLHPPILEKFGLKSAIESLANEVTRTGVLKVHVDSVEEWKEFSKSEELHIYRIVQELIHNTIKHAKASDVHIKVEDQKGNMTLQYSDNGKGLQNAENGKGLGLSSIETRVNLLNGKMHLDTKRKKGYLITFKL